LVRKKNPNATTEEFLNKKKELEQIIDPIISRAEAKIDLEKYANNAKKRMEDENDLNNYLTDKEKKIIDNATKDVLNFLKENPDATKSEIEKKKKLIFDKIDPILTRADAEKKLEDAAKNLKKNV